MIDVQLIGLLNATLQAATLLFIAGRRIQKAPPKNPETNSSKIYICELFIEVFM